MPVAPDPIQIRQFLRRRFGPYEGSGFMLRVQIYGKHNREFRIKLGKQDSDGEPHENPPHSWQEVGSIESLATLLTGLAQRAARAGANIAIAPALFEDGMAMGKGEVQYWLGFALDFDAEKKDKGRVAASDGLERLARAGLRPEAIVCTGSAWKRGELLEPKIHVLFPFNPPVPAAGIERAERVVRLITRDMGADPACAECSRILRLPGSLHPPDVDKEGREIFPAQLCQIVWSAPVGPQAGNTA